MRIKSSPYEKSSGLFLGLRSSKLVDKLTIHSASKRTECPVGLCNCGRETLLQIPDADLRVLRLTREDEKQLLRRLENLSSLRDLKHMEERMEQQLGIRLSIRASTSEVRSLRGITILVHEQPGLCRKTRQAISAAIKRSLEIQPAITYEILNLGGLFEIEFENFDE